MKRSYLDTQIDIAAPATAPGRAAIAVIKTAGPRALSKAAACFSRPEKLLALAGGRFLRGELVDPKSGDKIDEVVASVFRAPRSPTGDDCVEFSCHGSPAVLRRAMAALEAAGFVSALPGEFAFRAFAHGKSDMLRAEAMAELADAKSEAARADALVRLGGGLSRRVNEARTALVGLMAEASVRLDHDVEDGAPEAALSTDLVREVRAKLDELAATYATGRMLRDGAAVVIAGRPNAGKSSLFNLFLREERSIVSAEPGTTRDWIEAEVEVEGLRLRLLDTAGLRETDAALEAEGVSRSRRLIESADAVIYLVDGERGPEPAETQGLDAARALFVWNKIDLASCGPAPAGFLPLSSAEGRGFPELVAALVKLLGGRFGFEPSARASGERQVRVASERHKALLDESSAALGRVLDGLSAGLGLDIVALDLAQAAQSLGELTGEILSEEVLDSIFSRFCLGK